MLAGLGFAVMVALAVLFVPAASGAATLPAGFTQSLVDDGLDAPTTMTLAPDGRIFVAEQEGKLRVIKDGELLVTPFVDLSGLVDSAGERGLLGVAFDPDFPDNGYVYAYFTRRATETKPAHNRVVRFTAEGDRAVEGSARLIFRLDNLGAATNHNGGAIHFGEDGKLYIAVGENADPPNARTLKNVLGKMLRINKDGTIPRSNPFYDRKGVEGRDRAIWARGLRNPFSFAVQPGTGRMFINDVGARTWEEINRGVSGANYGWPIHEGPEAEPKYRPPVFAYRHDGAGTKGGCAITGGAFYNPQTVRFPNRYVGEYFFADICGGWIRRYDPAADTSALFATGISRPVDLKVSSDGSLYYLERGTGSVYRIQYPGRQSPAPNEAW